MTPETWTTILEKARSGLPLKLCAEAAGVSINTMEMWRAQQPELEAELAEARAIAAEQAWNQIGRAGKEKVEGDWRATSWQLEKAYPEDFQGRADVSVTNNVTTNTALQITIVEAQQIGERTEAVDAKLAELFHARRAIRDIVTE